MADLLTQTQFADTIGVAKSYITKLKQEGRLVMVDGKVDVDASTKRINETRDPNRDDVVKRHQQAREAVSAPQQPSEEEVATKESYAQARARKEAAMADMAERESLKQMGELVETDDVRAVASNAGATLRSHLERLPDQLAPELSVERNEDRIHALLVEHIEHTLQQVTRAITSGIDEAIH